MNEREAGIGQSGRHVRPAWRAGPGARSPGYAERQILILASRSSGGAASRWSVLREDRDLFDDMRRFSIAMTSCL